MGLPLLGQTVQMISRLQDIGTMAYGHADEPSMSAVSQLGF